MPIFRPVKNGQHFADDIYIWIFLWKKVTVCLFGCLAVFLSASVCLSVRLSVRPSVCLSVCLSGLCLSHLVHYVPIMVSSWNFQEWLPMTEVMPMQKFKVRCQKSRLQRSKPKLAVSRSSVKFQGHMARKIVYFDPNWAFPDSISCLNS